MRKTIGFLLVVGLLVGAMAAVALAATSGGDIAQTVAEGGFVDDDGDGVCDNFVDDDGDGVCDNANGAGTGTGDGYAHMGGRTGDDDWAGGRGASGGNAYQGTEGGGEFVDEDGDGVCDHAGDGEQQQMGHGHGRSR
ncbi:MAG: hypothetical protein KQH83_09495 [Actinobacteria bacterium]|nr:hypothetical protein [Actinomycetota bacterium]